MYAWGWVGARLDGWVWVEVVVLHRQWGERLCVSGTHETAQERDEKLAPCRALLFTSNSRADLVASCSSCRVVVQAPIKS